jgi:hypothetical protein
VRSQFSRIVVASILIICVICPLLEVFDRWDHTLQTGNDGEYAMVVLALCVGAMYSIARSAADVPRAEPDAEMKSGLGATEHPRWDDHVLFFGFFGFLIPLSPPVLELRL